MERRPAARCGPVAERTGRVFFSFLTPSGCFFLFFRSTLVERTVYTAQGVLSGLYPDSAADECAAVELNGATTTTTILAAAAAVAWW